MPLLSQNKMGSLWRSEPMQLVQLFVQIEAAHDTVDELGQLGVIQFRDVCAWIIMWWCAYSLFLFTLQLNPNVNAFHRNFVNEVKRCDEMERKLRFFEEQVLKEKGLNRILNSVSLENAASNSASINIDELEVSGTLSLQFTSSLNLIACACKWPN